MTRVPALRVLLAVGVALAWGILVVAQAGSWPSEVVVPRSEPDLARLLDPAIGTACTGDAAEVDIAGVGRARFEQITFDASSGSGRLAGAVCIDLVATEARLRTMVVDLSGLVPGDGEGPQPTLRSDVTAIDVAGWRVWVASIDGPLDALRLDRIVLIGPGAIGVARAGSLRDGVPLLEDVALVTDRYLLNAGTARFDGGSVHLEQVQASPCVCREGGLRILGDVADVVLTGVVTSGTVLQPRVALLGTIIPLGGTVTLGLDGVALDLPFTVRRDLDLGTLVGFRAPGLEDVEFAWGVAWQPRFGPWVAARFEDEVHHVDLRADWNGLTGSYRGAWGSWADADWMGYADVDVQRSSQRLHAGTRLRRPYAWPVPGTELRFEGAWSVDAMTFVDVDDDLGSILGGYLPVSANATVRTEPVAGVTMQLTSDVEAGPLTWRNASDGTQSAFVARWRVTPRLTIERDDWSANLAVVRQAVVGHAPDRAPFEADVRSRIEARGSWTGAAANASLDVAWRLPPETAGAERLRFRAAATLPALHDVTLRTEGEIRLAGLVGGDPDDAFVRAGIEAAMRDAWLVGVEAKMALPDRAVTSLALALRYPFTSMMGPWSVTVTPSLTIETASLWRDVHPLASHGLRIAVTECCATVFAAYEATGTDWSIDVGVDLPPFQFAGAPSLALPNVAALYGDEP